MEDERENMSEKETSEQEQDKRVLKIQTLKEANPEKNPQDDEEDLLYTHKSENRGSGIQWNSAFCKKPGR